MFQERWYQTEAALAGVKAVWDNPLCHPVVAMPTGSGKTPTLCMMIDELLTKNSKHNILVLSHVQEILEQDYSAIDRYFEYYADLGMYSAGLGKREIEKITVAGIQSVHGRIDEFKHFDYVIIDECHLIPMEEETMYRRFLKGIDATYIGLTATPYRTGHGHIYEGNDALFNSLAYDLTSLDSFNRLVDEGYLSELFSKPTALRMSTKGIKTIAGDFSTKDLSDRFDRKHITEAALIECLHYGDNYKHWLIFAIDINHANNITKSLLEKGISAVAVHSKMEGNRKKTLRDIKNGRYRVVVNVDVLTTGFDFPSIDLIIMLRPTKSPIIHVQTAGRGLRVIYADGYDLDTIEGRLEAIANGPKPHCLILDFAGNFSELGPINDVLIKKKGEKGTGQAMVKECPECTIQNHLSAKVCCNCGYEFPIKEKIVESAGTSEVVRKKPVEKREVCGWLSVDEINYEIVTVRSQANRGKNQVLVTYTCGFTKIREYVTIEHNGFPKHIAKNWIDFRWIGAKNELPKNCVQLMNRMESIMQATEILVDVSGKFANIKDAKFA